MWMVLEALELCLFGHVLMSNFYIILTNDSNGNGCLQVNISFWERIWYLFYVTILVYLDIGYSYSEGSVRNPTLLSVVP